MRKWRRLVLVIVFAAMVAVLAIILVSENNEKKEGAEPETIDVGVSYLPVTPELSKYYGLEVSYGALVTDVVRDSPADKARLKQGDVIVAFNGTELGEEISLLGIIRQCPAEDPITLEVWRGQSLQRVELVQSKS